MRVLLLILSLVSLVACSALKPRHYKYLVNKRPPVENSNLVTEQEQSIKKKQVNDVINEYKFNENFDDTPIEDISLNQVAPNYMEPMDIDYQVGLTEDRSEAKEVKLHEVQHRKHKKKSYTDLTNAPERKTLPVEQNISKNHETKEIEQEPQQNLAAEGVKPKEAKLHKSKKKSYPELSDIPESKTSAAEKKKITAGKKQELKEMQKKSDEVIRTDIDPVKNSKKEVVSAARPSKMEIEAKLKQLQSSASSDNVAIKDKLVPKTPEAKTDGVVAQNSNRSLPKIDLPSTPSPANPTTVAAPKSKSDAVGAATNNATQPPLSSSEPSIPTLPKIPAAPVVAANPSSNVVPSVPLKAPTSIPAQTLVPAPAPAQSPVPESPPPAPVLEQAPAPAVNSTGKTVKVNKDQSVEVYDSASLPPPLPPIMPPK